MNAPQPPAGTVVARAPIDHFAPSLTNRTHTAEHIADLGESIKLHDVVQPITARPYPAARGPAPDGVLYEIVIGEGRWRGARHAGLADIPFFWRELSDEQALELQLIENLKRKDLTAIEEAEGYRRLMKDHGHSADTLAAKIGKSRGYIYARIKLLDLCPPALKFFAEGKLDASTALLVARIPVPELQVAAAKKIAAGGGYYGEHEPMAYRRAAEMVQREFMLKLAEAPFPRADADLVPSAGRCHDCPKRTGNAADLFADVKSADMCIDPTCHEAKVAAHIKRQKEAAKKEGVKVIDGAEAKKIKPNSYGELTGGLVSLDKEVYIDGKYQTLRKALGKDAPPTEALIVDPHHKGKMIEAVATATIKEKLQAKGIDAGLGRRGKSTAEKEAERKHKQEATWRQRLFDQVRSRLTVDFSPSDEVENLTANEYRLVAESLFGRTGFDDQKRIARLWIGPSDEKQEDHALVHELAKRIANMERGDCCRLLIELAIVGDVSIPSYSDRKPEKLLAMANSLDIDTAAIKAAVIAEGREKAKAGKKVQPKTAKPRAAAGATDTAPRNTTGELTPGDKVIVNDSASGKGAKFIGKTGIVQRSVGDRAWDVTIGAKTTSFDRSELNSLHPGNSETASTPSPAAQAQGVGATAAAPAKPKGKKTAAKATETRTDPAPASPANEPPAAAKPSTPELADGLIYCHPDSPTLTWTGKGKEPAWVKELFKRGGGLEVCEIAKPVQTPGMRAWPFPPPADDTRTMTLPGVEEVKEAAEASA